MKEEEEHSEGVCREEWLLAYTTARRCTVPGLES